MAWKTAQGYTASDVNGNKSGLPALADGEPLLAATLNKLLRDLQPASYNAQLAGVLYGGQCESGTLDVKIPSGTSYFAKQVWTSDAVHSVNVPDEATTYIWGCSDGVIRTTATTTPPDGFDAYTACIITRATAKSGYATIDNTVQQRARFAATANRSAIDTGGFMPKPSSVPADQVFVIGEGHEEIFYGPFEVNGILVTNGRSKTEDW